MPKKRSKSPKRQKEKKKSSPSPPKKSGAGKRTKSKERKKSPSRAKESPLIHTMRIAIKATQVSEGSLENILQQLGGNDSRASLTIQPRESRGRSLVRADRISIVEPTIHSHIQKPLRTNSANNLQQMPNAEILRTQTTRRNSYRIDADQRPDHRPDPRFDYRENQKISERTFATRRNSVETPVEIYTGRNSEAFQEDNGKTIQYEVVPPAKEFHKEFQQRTSTEIPRDTRYAKDSKETNNNKMANQQMKQRDRNDTPDTVDYLLARPLSRKSSGELKPKTYQDTTARHDQKARQEYHEDHSHSSHEVHTYLPAPAYTSNQQVQQRNKAPESVEKLERRDYTSRQQHDEKQKSYLPMPPANVQPKNVPMMQDTIRKQPDQAQQKTMPTPKETSSPSDQILRRLSEQVQRRASYMTKDTTLHPDITPRKQPDQAQSKSMPPMTTRRPTDQALQRNIPSSLETMPRSDNKLRRQPDPIQQRDIPISQETIPRSNNILQRQLEQEEPRAMLRRQSMLPENISKQSDDLQETLTSNVLYKAASPHLVLYYDIMSPQARSCLMLICLLKLDVELRYTDIFKGEQLTEEYMKINPVHTVPTLVTDDMIFTDSHTILMYLCDNSSNPMAKQLYPQNYLTRLKIMNCLFFEAQVLYRRHSNFMTDIVRKEFANIDYAFHEKKILEAYETLNSFLKESQYLVGDTMTIADISMVATISALDLMFPIDQYQNVWPELGNWFRCMRAIPMYRLNFAGVMRQSDMVEKYGKFEFANKKND